MNSYNSFHQFTPSLDITVIFFLFPHPLVFFNISSLLVLLGLEFFAMIFLVVYVGAIVILFLFVVMMLNIKIVEIHKNVLRYLHVGGIIGFIFLLEIFFIINNDYIPILPKKLSTTYLTYIIFYCG
jgi:NADH:ubiquinone oxidoreductase subunit 6 (subunit J)